MAAVVAGSLHDLRADGPALHARGESRTEIEDQIRNGVADLSLNEAAALLMLSSNVRKLLNFAKQAKGLSGEALVEFCIENNVGVIRSHGYDPFGGRSEAEQLEWRVFVLFLSYDEAAGQPGLDPTTLVATSNISCSGRSRTSTNG